MVVTATVSIIQRFAGWCARRWPARVLLWTAASERAGARKGDKGATGRFVAYQAVMK
jgi:hypothetical protein